ncbi:MAG: U32 family peptidase [Verrucomicrobiota bacterium]
MDTNTTPELLAPAGNWDCARAAVAAGADAIYFGMPAFNARLRADNFTESDLAELMDFLHRHGVKGFLTMNTLIFTGELDAAARQLRLAQTAGVDAFIIQDLGLAEMAVQLAPGVEIHASTQMTITSPDGLRFVENLLPLKRAVLARELSVGEIQKFHAGEDAPKREDAKSRTPLEVFVHGALCVAYSGQCLTSESLGQRSANRGECAQACRMPYELIVDGMKKELGEHRYLLSPQDLAAIDLIPDLLAAGVKSYKIEGRLKSPEYVAAVTRAYRKALDGATGIEKEVVTPEDHYALEMTFSRGLTTGWLGGTNHPYLTHGRFGKKRGPLLGTIAAIGKSWLSLSERTGIPVKAGDGIVIDEGLDRNEEQGARIFRTEGERIYFDRRCQIDFSRLKPGQAVHKTSDPVLDSRLRKYWQNTKLKETKNALRLTVSGSPGRPLRASSEGVTAESEQILERATKNPLTTETLIAQLGRLGNTPYELASLDNQLNGDCHLPLSQLNHLRRALVEKLDRQQNTVARHQPESPAATYTHLLPKIEERPSVTPTPTLTVLTRTLDQVRAALESNIPIIYCDFEDPRRYREALGLQSSIDNQRSKVYLATPRIIKASELGYLKHIASLNPHGLLLRNLAALDYYRDSNLPKIGDFSLNVTNPISARLLRESAQLERLTISYDLNITQVLDLLDKTPPHWLELTLHQHMPLFHMEHCVFCTFMSEGTSYKDCGRPCDKHTVHLRDRVGQLHRLHADVGCRNTLFNGRAQTGAAYYRQLRDAGLSHFRLELLDQSHAESTQLVEQYQALLNGEQAPAQLLEQLPAMARLGVTEGTLK